MTSISGRRSQSSMRSGAGSDFYEPPTAQEIMVRPSRHHWCRRRRRRRRLSLAVRRRRRRRRHSQLCCRRRRRGRALHFLRARCC